MSHPVSPAPTAPAWKRFLAGTSITIGVLMMLTAITALTQGSARGVIGAFVAGTGILLPGVMWRRWQRQDDAARDEAVRASELTRFLTDADREWLGDAAAPEPQLAQRRWGRVAIISGLLIVVGSTIMPPADQAASTRAPGVPPTSSESAPPAASSEPAEPSTEPEAPSETVTPEPEPAVPAPAVEPESPAAVAPEPEPAPAPSGPSYSSCAEARAAGAAPLYAGSPGYSSSLDRDGDGVACE